MEGAHNKGAKGFIQGYMEGVYRMKTGASNGQEDGM